MNKQGYIIQYLLTVEQATIREIYAHIPFGYYANGTKHLGEILSRMVKNREIHRVKKGVYAIKKPSYPICF